MNKSQQMSALLQEGPADPIVDPILDLHRGPDGLVAFGRKPLGGASDTWEELGAVSITKLRDVFPEFREELSRDA
jgi:hypothetical protein